MNQQDRKEFEIVHIKIDDMRQDLVDLRREMSDAHKKNDESLSFIKENLFNPHEGLWAETKQNSQFREDSKKWRFPIGVGFILLAPALTPVLLVDSKGNIFSSGDCTYSESRKFRPLEMRSPIGRMR